MAPPGEAYEFKTTMDQIGLLTLTWKCKNHYGAVGTMYEITRIVDGVRMPPVKVGKKRFVDTKIRTGTKLVIYQICGVRGQTRGNVANHSVCIGNDYDVPGEDDLNYPPGTLAA